MKSIYPQKEFDLHLSIIGSITTGVKTVSVMKRILEIECVHTDCI